MAANTDRKMKNDTLGRERRNHLKERINSIARLRYHSKLDAAIDPPAIAKARKLVERYDERRHKASSKRAATIRDLVSVAHGELLRTDSFDAGLRVVEKLEATAKRRKWLTEADDGE